VFLNISDGQHELEAPEYLILNCASTKANWLGTSATLAQINAALPGYMQIDYVRSWSEGP